MRDGCRERRGTHDILNGFCLEVGAWVVAMDSLLASMMSMREASS
jgi:hypothetical protein